jgi:hypothetical protein
MVKRVQGLAEEVLANRSDLNYDLFLKGMIHAYREMLDPQPETNLTDLMELEEDDNEV